MGGGVSIAGSLVPLRLRRLRWLAWLLDDSLQIGRWRVGLDPLIGLVPGVGDAIGALLSFIVFYDAARLGLPTHVLWRMVGNIAVETLAGLVPLLGDAFDFVWKANARNIALVERYYDPLRPERNQKEIVRTAWVSVIAVATLFFLGATVAAWGLWKLFEKLP